MLNAFSSVLPGAHTAPSQTPPAHGAANTETNDASTSDETPLKSPRPVGSPEADKMTQTDNLEFQSSSARRMGTTGLPRGSQALVSDNGQRLTPAMQTNGWSQVNTRHGDGAAPYYLQRATARDLPSYPTAGLTDPNAAGAAAASLAHSSSKPIEAWKPNPISAAGAAASLAHANQKSPDAFVSRSTGGQSAAVTAIGGSGGDSKRYVLSDSAKRSSLTAALGATGTQAGRKRSVSTPTMTAPSQEHRAMNGHAPTAPSPDALSAVRETSRKRRAKVSSPYPEAQDGSRGHYRTDVGVMDDRTDIEKRKSDVVRAASASMAKSRRSEEKLPPAASEGRPRYPHLEEHARKIALERLARHGHDPNRRSRPRSMTSPEALGSSEAMRRADHPNGTTTREEQRKRGQDALLLMTVARRNVQTRLTQQDREIADSKGIVRREEWEEVASRIAQKESDARIQTHESHRGKVDIGFGRYVDQAEIDRIAERNVRPVLDDIDEKATEERKVRDEAKAKEVGNQMDRENERRAASFIGRQEKDTEKVMKKSKVLRTPKRKRFSLKSVATLPAAAIAPAFSHSNGRKVNSTDDRRFSTSHHPEIRKVSVCPMPPDFGNPPQETSSAPPSALAMGPIDTRPNTSPGPLSPTDPSSADCRPNTSDGLPFGTGQESSTPPRRLLSVRRRTPQVSDERAGLNAFGMVRSPRTPKSSDPKPEDSGGTPPEKPPSRSKSILKKLRRNILPKRDGAAANTTTAPQESDIAPTSAPVTATAPATTEGNRVIGSVSTSSTDPHGVAHGRSTEGPQLGEPEEEDERLGMCLNKDTTDNGEVLEEERLRRLREAITGSPGSPGSPGGVGVGESRFTEDF